MATRFEDLQQRAIQRSQRVVIAPGFYRLELADGRRRTVRRICDCNSSAARYVLETEHSIHPAEYDDFHAAIWDAVLDVA